jgi:hypothetical protein
LVVLLAMHCAADVKYMQRKLVFGGLLWAEHSCKANGPNGHWSSQIEGNPGSLEI